MVLDVGHEVVEPGWHERSFVALQHSCAAAPGVSVARSARTVKACLTGCRPVSVGRGRTPHLAAPQVAEQVSRGRVA